MPDELRNRMVVPRVVWLAMLASTWIYGLVAVLVTGAIATGDHPPAPAGS